MHAYKLAYALKLFSAVAFPRSYPANGLKNQPTNQRTQRAYRRLFK